MDTSKTTEPYKPDESFLDKSFLPTKPIPHSPKISPSSIPNPNPSVSSIETYPSYGNYPFSIPGYSAFQPVSYPGMIQPQACVVNETTSPEYEPFHSVKDNVEEISVAVNTDTKDDSEAKEQTDFEEQFTPEIIPALSLPEAVHNPVNETNDHIAKVNFTSNQESCSMTSITLAQKATNTEITKKPTERFSLKTSIPISKIDMKCVNTPDVIYLNSTVKKPVLSNPDLTNTNNEPAKIEIQSNVVIKNAAKDEGNLRSDPKPTTTGSDNINALINAAEALNKKETFRRPDSKREVKNKPPKDAPNYLINAFRPTNYNAKYIRTNSENNKDANKPPDGTPVEQKKIILYPPNSPQSNTKVLPANQQPNPQVLLQRTNMESKNLPAPSRLSSQSKRDNGAASKVVALKRLHHENCDENDFENLITENQIYGNKIVVKEKSQGIQQEQDPKKINKLIENKTSSGETKNVVLQPNFLYLSNVQFPNLMMVKNNAKLQMNETKSTLHTTNENKNTSEACTMTSNEITSNLKNMSNAPVGKEIHVLKSSNNILQTVANKNGKNDIIFQKANQKVIMNPQILYQVPMIVDTDNKRNPKLVGQPRKEYVKTFEQKSSEKLYIACPYQMDSKLKPKIVITNIRPKLTKAEEVSTLDLYEKRKRIRRMKHLTHRDAKDGVKNDTKKTNDILDNFKHFITPDRMKEEIAKEFANMKLKINESCSESESDFEDLDLHQYQTIIKEFDLPSPHDKKKSEFLSYFRLATHDDYKEKQMERQERIIKRDAVAAACIAVGRIDRLTNDTTSDEDNHIQKTTRTEVGSYEETIENEPLLQRKMMFFSLLQLEQVSTQYREEYERTWQEIVKERKRRNGETDHILKQPKLDTKKKDFNTADQLKMLTEINKSVNENNNLIKKRLDSGDETLLDGDSIRILAEKNFSELNRLSKMADRSVKLITGQQNKRDLTPGFDSEKINKSIQTFEQPFQINIPNMSNIISLKSQETMTSQATSTMTSQATSMDEPMSSAAGATEMPDENVCEKAKDVGIQVETWPGVEVAMKTYKEYVAVRSREISYLNRRNTLLRVENAYITRQAGRNTDRARAMLAELRHLANEEASTRAVLDKLCAAVQAIRGFK